MTIASSNTMTSTTSAAERTLNIPELLEQILQHLPA
ncbi:hypothetical protein CLAFUW4_12546 [Fulvia fulva]|nr:uncharacterized protein CLAFUR5_20336 [Fulvia fulva]KAK4617461.1 hypothetical protein CLAFUR4_12551 [Fulvia fulva]KAK4618920.1 hypothetical protein CLAFUR0_12562 [Fulvia fulva]WMI38990.1 hypothetical protein CLAFUR5_20336 [Fulvia fulva]WPV18263.1 hypothetical protein CLAFUW4_12546 [Fulvia fulva]WPV32947.1 hypothetical protein CLAFUW7_12553 [Fulvia fulva]